MSTLLKLEDRVLVLRDRVDTAKAFDPNQLRDRLGRWANAGGSAVGGAARGAARVAGSGAKNARAWFKNTKIKQHLPKDLKGTARDIATTAISALVTQYNQSNIDEEAVRTALRNLSVGLKLSTEQAREILRSSVSALRSTRLLELKDDDDTNKAKPKPKDKDKVVEICDKILSILDKKNGKKIDLARLEDRALVLRNKIDVLKAKYDPNQPRDKDGQWSASGAGTRRGFLQGLGALAATVAAPAGIARAVSSSASTAAPSAASATWLTNMFADIMSSRSPAYANKTALEAVVDHVKGIVGPSTEVFAARNRERLERIAALRTTDPEGARRILGVLEQDIKNQKLWTESLEALERGWVPSPAQIASAQAEQERIREARFRAYEEEEAQAQREYEQRQADRRRETREIKERHRATQRVSSGLRSGSRISTISNMGDMTTSRYFGKLEGRVLKLRGQLDSLKVKASKRKTS